MSTSDEIDIFHKYVYIYTKGLFGDNRYIVPQIFLYTFKSITFYFIYFPF